MRMFLRRYALVLCICGLLVPFIFFRRKPAAGFAKHGAFGLRLLIHVGCMKKMRYLDLHRLIAQATIQNTNTTKRDYFLKVRKDKNYNLPRHIFFPLFSLLCF